MYPKIFKNIKGSKSESLSELIDFVSRLVHFTLPILTPVVIQQVQYLNDKNIKQVLKKIDSPFALDVNIICNIISKYELFRYNCIFMGCSIQDRIKYCTIFIKSCNQDI